MARTVPTSTLGQLEQDIRVLQERVTGAPQGKDLKARCARAYVKALLDSKRHALAVQQWQAGHRADKLLF